MSAARGSHPEHVRELAGSHLDTDAGEEPDQDGAGQEIRQEPEPGQPGKQQQRPGQQGREPGQLHVSRDPATASPARAAARMTAVAESAADDEVTRGTENGEHDHRQQHRVQAGHHRHPGDLRVPEDLRDAQGGQRQAGEHVRRYLGPVDRQQPPHRGQRPQPSSLSAPTRIRQPSHHRPFPC